MTDGLVSLKGFLSDGGSTLGGRVDIVTDPTNTAFLGDLVITKVLNVSGKTSLGAVSVGTLKLPNNTDPSKAKTPLCADTMGTIVKC